MPSQIDLDFAPRPAPLPPVVDQRVPREDRARLCRMSRAILERLRRGAATNRELAAMFPDGAAWRTRVSDVRRYLEHQGETVAGEPLGEGLHRYWITAKEAAPDVLLVVDHVVPVAKGGENEILNLVTSCDTCNAGKGAVPLSDSSAVKKQLSQVRALSRSAGPSRTSTPRPGRRRTTPTSASSSGTSDGTPANHQT